MGRASTPLHNAGDRLATARDRFLAAEPVDSRFVREPILASWWRSREWRVAPDHLDLNYLRPPDLESALPRAAEPVLRHLHEQLDGQPISILLTDAAGLVLFRFTGDRDLERHLDSIMLAPGFSYAEDIVGTNGIGTALEAGGTRPRVRPRALRRESRGHGLRRGADQGPGIRQDRRGDRPDLLAS